MSVNIESDLCRLFTELEEALGTFQVWWPSHMESTEVYAVEVLTEAEAPEAVAVQTLTGQAAADAASRAYEQFELLEDQALGTAFRLPGVIRVNSGDLALVHRVNACKHALRDAVREAEPNAMARARLCRRLFGGRYMAQVYRQVPVVEPPALRLSFGWSSSTIASRQLSVQAACELIEMRAASSDQAGWVAASALALDALARCPAGTIVRQRTPVAPHPRLTVTVEEGRPARRVVHHANLPAVVSATCADVPTRPLESFDASKRRARRSDALDVEAVFEALNLVVPKRPSGARGQPSARN